MANDPEENDDDGIHRMDTVPPPDGEGDAYNAATRVGPMADAVVKEMMHAAGLKAAEMSERAAGKAKAAGKASTSTPPVAAAAPAVEERASSTGPVARTPIASAASAVSAGSAASAAVPAPAGVAAPAAAPAAAAAVAKPARPPAAATAKAVVAAPGAAGAPPAPPRPVAPARPAPPIKATPPAPPVPAPKAASSSAVPAGKASGVTTSAPPIRREDPEPGEGDALEAPDGVAVLEPYEEDDDDNAATMMSPLVTAPSARPRTETSPMIERSLAAPGPTLAPGPTFAPAAAHPHAPPVLSAAESAAAAAPWAQSGTERLVAPFGPSSVRSAPSSTAPANRVPIPYDPTPPPRKKPSNAMLLAPLAIGLAIFLIGLLSFLFNR